MISPTGFLCQGWPHPFNGINLQLFSEVPWTSVLEDAVWFGFLALDDLSHWAALRLTKKERRRKKNKKREEQIPYGACKHLSSSAVFRNAGILLSWAVLYRELTVWPQDEFKRKHDLERVARTACGCVVLLFHTDGLFQMCWLWQIVVFTKNSKKTFWLIFKLYSKVLHVFKAMYLTVGINLTEHFFPVILSVVFKEIPVSGYRPSSDEADMLRH